MSLEDSPFLAAPRGGTVSWEAFQAQLKARPYLGHAVADGALRYVSATAVDMADPAARGCLAKWWFRYVGGRAEHDKARFRKAKDAGISLDDEVARYLVSGERALSSLAMRGSHMLPEPGLDRAVVRHWIAPGSLRADGVPFIGEIDYAHWRGTNKGAEDFLDAVDPDGTVEIIDWKRKGNGTFRDGTSAVPTPAAVGDSTQMVAYGTYALRAWGARQVRLSHGVFVDQPRDARKVTLRVLPDHLEPRWARVEGVVRTLRDVARVVPELDRHGVREAARLVPGNRASCEAFGGCPHREACPHYQHNSLASLYGEEETNQSPQALSAGKEKDMSVMDEIEKLEQEEKRRGAAEPDPRVREAWQTIKELPYGHPVLQGAAAVSYAAASGLQLTAGASIAGQGKLAVAPPILTVEDVVRLAADIRAHAAKTGVIPSTPVQVAPAPPPSPPAPPIAAYVAQVPPPVAPPDMPAPAPVQAPSFVVGKELKDGVAPAPSAPLAAVIPIAPASAPEAAKRGRPKKGDAQPAPAGGVQVFVDCTPSAEHEQLWPYVAEKLAALARSAGIPDARTAVEGPLGYGRWTGALAAAIRQDPPPAGAYVLDTRGSQAAEVAAEALRDVATLYVRGFR